MSTEEATINTTEKETPASSEADTPAAPQDVKSTEAAPTKGDEKPAEPQGENGDKREDTKEDAVDEAKTEAEDVKEKTEEVKPEEKESKPEEKPEEKESKPEEKPEEKESKPEEKPEEKESKPEEKPEEKESKPEEKPEEKESKPEEKIEESKSDEKEESKPEEKKEDSMDVDEPKEDQMETDEPKEDQMETDEKEEVVKTPAKIQRMLGDFLETPGSATTPSGKRTRKSVERHEPELLKKSKTADTKPGRGQKLSAIPSVEKLISKRTRNDPVLKDAHKMLYGFGKKGGAASPGVNSLKKMILDYSGFLFDDSTEEEDTARIEKFKIHADKVKLPALREICDLFDIDRSAASKEVMVDRLTDFLATPDPKYTKTGAKAATKKKTTPVKRKAAATPSKGAKRRKKTEDSDVTEDKPEEEEVEDPTEEELRTWVNHYVNCFNLDKATTKHAIETVSDKFGKNLNHKKTLIKELLADELNKDEKDS